MSKNSLKVLWLIAMLVLTSSAFAQRIAIFDFNAGTGVTQVEVDGLSAIFNTYFSPKGAQIIERTRVDRLLQEQRFQKSKFTTTDMVAMGEQLNASLVVVGDVNVIMEQYNVDIRVVNVQTGTIVAKDGISFEKNSSYRGTMQQLGERLAKQMELEIEKINIESKPDKPEIKDEKKKLPEDMTTKITEDNSKRERTDVVVLHGYLKLYPEDLGEFGEKPSTLIKKINEEEKYGYDSWRLPTEEEMDIISSKGYLSGLKYMTKSDPRGVLLLVTTKDPVVHKPKLSIAKENWAVGLVGGFDYGLQVKKYMGNSSLDFRGVLHCHGFQLAGLYEWNHNLGSNFTLYYGVGAGLGAWKVIPSYDMGFGLDIEAIVGVEWQIPGVPLALSLDYRPAFEILPGVGFYAKGFAFGIKYLF